MFTFWISAELCLSLVFCANVLDVLPAEDRRSLILRHASASPRHPGGFGLCRSQKLKDCLIPVRSRTLPGTAPPISVLYRGEARGAVGIRGD